MTNRIPYRKDAAIGAEAQAFLSKYQLDTNTPVDIELLIEKLGIDIVVVPGMERKQGFDCYITSDFKKVMIDEFCFESQETRARFSLAHELAHFILHRDIYLNSNIKTEEDFINFSKGLSDEEHKRMEIQAHIFAGFLLLPPVLFEESLENIVSEYGGSEFMTITDLQPIVNGLAKKFFVTDYVIQKQLMSHYKEWLGRTFDGLGEFL